MTANNKMEQGYPCSIFYLLIFLMILSMDGKSLCQINLSLAIA